ncbi:hypothetical protein Ait01nite_024870 [Actinoplanes italicus]|nr:hypothetical protein Ait01nite_024870 [Actinoplanes italicus]
MACADGSIRAIAALAAAVAPTAITRSATDLLIRVLTFMWGLGSAFKRGESAFLARIGMARCDRKTVEI